MSKPKSIYLTDTEAVETRLAEINGRVQRSVTSADLANAVRDVEKRLALLGLPKKSWNRVAVEVDPQRNRQPSVNAYRYRATAVSVYLAYRVGKGWYITGGEAGAARNDNVANRHDAFLTIPVDVLDVGSLLGNLGVAATV